MNSDKTVLLLGSYGQTNIGDDLLMWNYLNFLQSRGFKKIYVNANEATNVPAIIRQSFPKLKMISQYNTGFFDWLRILGQIDYVVYGGGTVYKELYGSTGRGKYSVIVRIMGFNLLARLRGAKIYHLHIGIGELHTWLGRFITGRALRTSAVTIFRDNQSYKFAHRTLKLPMRKICQATDGLFLAADLWQTPWHHFPFRVPPGKYKRVVGVNLLSDIPDWVDRQVYLQAVRGFINGLLADKTFVLLVPFQHDFNPNNDLEFMRNEVVPHLRTPENFRLIEQVPIDQIVSCFERLDVFVGMRFHSLLLATLTTTPFVGIAYDTKCFRFMKDSKYPYHVPLANMQAKDIHRTYKALVSNLPQLPHVLRVIARQHQQKGQQCLEQLAF